MEIDYKEQKSEHGATDIPIHVKSIREREYEIGMVGTPTQFMKTGWLSSCIAFYGSKGGENGRAFLCHLDWHPRGMDCMIRELKASNRNDLGGFEVYVTSGLGWIGRVLWACFYSVVVGIAAHSVWHNVFITAFATALIGLISASYYFGPLWRGYRIICSHFGKGPKVKFLRGCVFKRVEITVDASKSVQEDPRIETEASSKTKLIYKPRKGHWFYMPIERTSVAEATEAKRSQSRKTTGIG
ncbi:hypothetical protein [Paraburkholderia sp. CI3]|uniref:hypothetical protein n=1 Tax=Paraburkholderia sp. CI3 TaxID=2991060 RepID=UPI003D2262CF